MTCVQTRACGPGYNDAYRPELVVQAMVIGAQRKAHSIAAQMSPSLKDNVKT